jgi:hypothetical protein
MKSKIQIGYKTWVLDHDKAVQLLTLLDDAELYDSKYEKEQGVYTHYVYHNDEVKPHNLELIPDKLYAMWKLAGKPNKE